MSRARPFYEDGWLSVFGGDCREVMAGLEPESVNCVVTSPPYWGLRDYGTATWVGGDEACDHTRRGTRSERPRSGLEGGLLTVNHAQEPQYRESCGRCGARRVDAQIGLEMTPDAYVTSMVGVFRAVRRILRADGTLWLNLGDTYATDRGGTPQPAETLAGGSHGEGGDEAHRGRPDSYQPHRDARAFGLKGKDLVGIPWRVAFALQADGWYLRADVIWAKPNPMPESVTDRPTRSHEYLFLLSQSPRYFYDADSVREPSESAGEVRGGGWKASTEGIHGNRDDGQRLAALGQKPTAAVRNLRSVWSIATQPYPGAHFAAFPEKLVEPCIKAGTPPGGVVLDPFAGTGTVGRVAQSLSRKAILIDLNPDYLTQALQRNRDIPLGLEVA